MSNDAQLDFQSFLIPAVELKNINKSFGPVVANNNICLKVFPHSIHGIIGENGAGKSTLMDILYGYYTADSGEIVLSGKAVHIQSPHHAIEYGIGMVFQHFMLVENFTVLENILLGVEGGARLKSGKEKARKTLESIEHEYQLEVDLDSKIEDLSVGHLQRVEILKALYRGADILILDEPTGVLTPQEVEHLFRILNQLRDQGKTIILITHKLKEILAITDYVSVMRSGEMVTTLKTSETNCEELAEWMVGRKVSLQIDKQPCCLRNTVLKVDHVSTAPQFHQKGLKDVSFEIRAGEIVGIAGVAGNGQTQLLEVLAGLRPVSSGSWSVHDCVVTPNHPVHPSMIRHHGVGHIPEDRLKMGLIKDFFAFENTILGYHWDHEYGYGPCLSLKNIKNQADDWLKRYDVRPCDKMMKAGSFSGGNQQKIVIAREIEHDPDLLLVGQPTRGVDIGAIEFIHKKLVALRDAGKAILLVSVELDEIMALSDRILVMYDGRVVGEFLPNEVTEQTLGLYMAGGGSQ